MKGKWMPHIIAVIAFVVFIILGLACASTEESVQNEESGLNINNIQFVYTEIPFSDLMQSIEKVNELGHGFIVNAYFGGDSDYLTICDTPIANMFDRPKNSVRIKNGIRGSSWNDLIKRYDKNVVCKIYIKTWSDAYLFGPDYRKKYIDEHGFNPYGIVDKIEGLLTIEQADALRTQKEAEEKAADEKANRYDASKFTIVPTNFRPADYTSIDLFTAVSDVEKMKSAVDLGYYTGGLGIRGWYVSNVVFVDQNGTDIRFRTNDNTISRSMKVEGRSGLTSGQRVRVYYTVTKDVLAEWRVVAIERL
jgi:hypothetical protein